MKFVTTGDYNRYFGGLTGEVDSQALVKAISFLNTCPINLFNAFFIKSEKEPSAKTHRKKIVAQLQFSSKK